MFVSANNAAGSAAKENAKQVDSLQGRLNALTSAWQAFSNTVLDSDFLKEAVTFLKELLEILDALVDNFGVLGTVGMGVTSVGIFKYIKEDIFGIKEAVESISDITETASNITNAMSDITDAMSDTAKVADTVADTFDTALDAVDAVSDISETASNVADTASNVTDVVSNMADTASNVSETASNISEAVSDTANTASNAADAVDTLGDSLGSVKKKGGSFVSFLKSPMGVAAAITAVVTAISAIYNAIKNYKEKLAAERQEIMDESDEFLNSYSSFEQVYIKYSGKTNLTAEEESELESAINGTVDALDAKTSSLHDAVNSSNDYVTSLENIADAELAMAEQQAKAKRDAAQTELEETVKGWWAGDGSEVNVELGASGNVEARELAEEIFGSKYFRTKLIADALDSYSIQLDANASMEEILDYYYKLLEYQEQLSDAGLSGTAEYKKVTDVINNMANAVDLYTSGVYDAVKAEYQLANGIPTTIDDYLKMRASVLNSIKEQGGTIETLKIAASDLDSSYLSLFDLSNEEQAMVNARSLIGIVEGYGDEQAATFETLLNMRTAVNNGDCTVGEYLDVFRDAQTEAGKFSDEAEEEIKLAFGLDSDSIEESYSKITGKLRERYGYEADELIGNLTASQLTAAINLDYEGEIDWENVSLEELEEQIKAEAELIEALNFSVNITGETEWLETMNGILAESASAAGLTAESITALENRYQSLEGYDASRLFEKTANGIKVNRSELAKLESSYQDLTSTEIQEHLDTLVDEYNRLTGEIDKCSNASERAKLISERESYAEQIEELATYQAQLEGLTGAYQKWIDAQSGPENYEGYENVAKGYETVSDEISRGFIGNSSKAYIDLLSGEDLSDATYSQYKKAFNKLDDLVGSTQYSILDFFTLDEDGNITDTGIDRFFEGMRQDFKGSVAKFNEETGKWEYDFSQENLEKIQSEWGMGIDAIELMLEAAADAGYDIDWGGILDGIDLETSDFESLISTAQLVQDELNDITGKNYSFNFTATSVKDATAEIDKARSAYLDLITNDDGTLNLEAEGAEEMRFIMSTLIIQKQQLSTPAIMKVDTSQLDESQKEIADVITAAQNFQTAYENYEIAISTGVDVEEAEAELSSAIAALEGTDAEIRADLKLPSNEQLQAAASEVGTIKVGTSLDSTAIGTLETQIQTECTPEVIATVTGLDETAIQNGEGGRKVVYTPEHSAVDEYVNSLADINKSIIYTYTTEGTKPNPSNINRKIIYEYEVEGEGPGGARGTAFAFGTTGKAFKSGNWGTKSSGTALVGELGTELLVRDGRFYTIGEDSAEFVSYKKGDIIFNAEQTKQIFEKGKIAHGNKRGKAFATGNAFYGGATINVHASGGDAVSKEVRDALALDVEVSLSADTSGVEKFNSILGESAIAADSVYEAMTWTEERYGNIEGFDISKVFISTANGMRVNTEEAARLEAQYRENTIATLEAQEAALNSEYAYLAARRWTASTIEEYEEVTAAMEEVSAALENNLQYQSMLENTVFAENPWINVESYEDAAKGIKTVTDELASGKLSDASKEIIDFLSPKNLFAEGATVDEYAAEFERIMETALAGTNIKLSDIVSFDENGNLMESGVHNLFLLAQQAFKDEIAFLGEDGLWTYSFTNENIEYFARMLGLSPEFIQSAIEESAAENGYNVNLTEAGYIVTDSEFAKETREAIAGAFDFDFAETVEGIEAVNAALVESSSATGLTAETVATLKERYGELDSFNASNLFIQTANGIRLNREELERLEEEQQNAIRSDIQDHISQLESEYQALTVQILECSDAEERAALIDLANAKQDEIDTYRMYEVQLDATTGAYQRWINAQSMTEGYEGFTSVAENMSNIEAELEQGYLSDASKALIDLLSPKDLKNASFDEYFEEYGRLVEEGLSDVFTFDEESEFATQGIHKFFMDVQKDFEGSIAKFDEATGKWTYDFGAENLQMIADEWGMSLEDIQILLDAASSVGYNIDWSTATVTESDFAVKFREEMLNAFDFDIESEMGWFDTLNSMFEESATASGLSAESIAQLRERYGDLAGFDISNLLDKTANGFKLNREELYRLESQIQATNQADLQTEIERLTADRDALTQQIIACTDAEEAYRLEAEREIVNNQIEERTLELEAYQMQLAGATGALQRFLDAQSMGEDYDNYVNVAGSREGVEDDLSRGVLSNTSKAYIDLISPRDLAAEGATIDDYISEWEKSIDDFLGSTSYKIADIFSLDENGDIISDGIHKFFDGMQQDFEGSVAKFDNETGKWTYDFSEQNLQMIQDRWGMSIDEIQLLLESAASAGYNVDWSSVGEALSASVSESDFAIENRIMALEESFDFDLDTEIEGIEAFKTALEESASASGLTTESIEALQERYKDIEGFDAAKLFEKTAQGVKLNQKEVKKLESQYRKGYEKKLTDNLDALCDEYDSLTYQIGMCTDVEERANLYAQRDIVAQKIQDMATLESQIRGTTSAYLEWEEAQSTENPGSKYDEVAANMFEAAEELYANGDVGTDDFRSAVQFMTNKDLTFATTDEIVQAYLESRDRHNRYYKEDTGNGESNVGLQNLLTDLEAANDAWVDYDESTGKYTVNIENMQEAADALGISLDSLYVLFGKLEDKGFVVDYTSEYDDMKTHAQEASDALSKTLGIDNRWEFGTGSIDKINDQLESTEDLKYRIANSPLEFGFEDGSQEQIDALREVDTILLGLLKEKQELEKPAIMGISVSSENATTPIGKTVTLVKELSNNLNLIEQSEYDASVNVDKALQNVSTIGGAIQTIASQNPEVDIYASLGWDESEVQQFNTAMSNINNPEVSPEIRQESIDIIQSLIGSAATEGLLMALGEDSGITGIASVSVEPETTDLGDEFTGTGIATMEPETLDMGNDFYGTGKVSLTAELTNSFVTVEVRTNTSSLQGTINEVSGGFANGTAFANGTVGKAFRNGDWGIKSSGTALVGELGQELVVRNGRFFTIGDNGAEFFHYKKNDIIFNAGQTKQLFEQGKISNGRTRGRALASGTAFVEGVALESTYGVDTNGGFYGVNGTIGYYPYSGSSSSSSSSSSSDDADEFLETLDWIEVAIDRIERAISLLDLKASSTFKKWSTRNAALVDEIEVVRNEINLQTAAYERYLQEANSVGLSEDYAAKVRNGEINIEDITDESLKEMIDEYQEWYEKALDCRDAVEELKEQVSELYKQKFDNVSTQFEGILGVIEHEKSMLEEFINQSEAQAWLVSSEYYDALAANERETIAELEKQKAEQLVALNDAVASGAVEMYSETWYEMVAAIDETTLAIEESNTQLLEYAQTLQELEWEQFDILEDKISRITSESEFLIDLLSSDELYGDSGQLTASGMSTMGLHGLNYNVEMAQADAAGAEAARIKAQMEEDPFDQDLIDRYNEMIDLQQEHILAAQDEKEAIRDMVEEGIELELDALQELIDKYNESLDSQKDLYDYQKKVKEQTEEIASLEKQMAAYSGDNSEETRAKVQELKVSLEEAKQELEETEYERFISDSEELLDSLYLEYETIINERLDNLELLITEQVAMINENSGLINETLMDKVDSVGTSLSTEMGNIWNTSDFTTTQDSITNGSNVIKDVITTYGDKFSEAQTTTNNVLKYITQDVASMIGQLNKLAKTNVKTAAQSTAAKSKEASGSKTTSSTTTTTKTNTTSGDGTPKVGDKVKFVSGKYYYDSQGKTPLGSQHLGQEVYITKINTASWATHPYHISTGTKLGSGDLGWLKLNQISGYATGKRTLLDDELAWTQENGEEFIIRPSDGAILTPLAKSDSVLSAAASNNLWNMANNPADFIKDNLGIGNVSTNIGSGGQTNVVQNFDQIVFSMPNVENYEQLLSEMQKDKNFERLILSMTVDQIAGKSSLAKGKALR